MPRAAKPTRTDGSAEPNKLLRQQAGTYRTPDERFEVREADGGWFLVDSEQTNEFGQELIQGPFPTLKAVREALPEARAAERTRAARPSARKATKAAKGRAKEAPPRPPPPSWIEQLPREEAAGVRRLIQALEKDGVTDAEALVRRDRDGLLPAVATRLIERRLDALVQDMPDGDQRAARALLKRAAEVISAEGSTLTEPLPGWTLVEIGPEPEPPNRRIDLRR